MAHSWKRNGRAELHMKYWMNTGQNQIFVVVFIIDFPVLDYVEICCVW
jgi:hypothetical protein